METPKPAVKNTKTIKLLWPALRPLNESPRSSSFVSKKPRMRVFKTFEEITFTITISDEDDDESDDYWAKFIEECDQEAFREETEIETEEEPELADVDDDQESSVADVDDYEEEEEVADVDDTCESRADVDEEGDEVDSEPAGKRGRGDWAFDNGPIMRPGPIRCDCSRWKKKKKVTHAVRDWAPFTGPDYRNAGPLFLPKDFDFDL